jgi:hypothetical protein
MLERWLVVSGCLVEEGQVRVAAYETRSSSFSAWETGEKCKHSKPCTSTT